MQVHTLARAPQLSLGLALGPVCLGPDSDTETHAESSGVRHLGVSAYGVTCMTVGGCGCVQMNPT